MAAPITRVGAGNPRETQRTQTLPGQTDFGKELKSAVERQRQVRLSAHAQKRLQEVKPRWSAEDQARLEAVTDEMRKKGASRSLVLMDGIAFLVSVRNRVVITAVDGDRATSGIFTDIDSAAIAPGGGDRPSEII